MYIIGDVHGCFKTLLALIDKLPLDEEIFFTGDLIDRGPQSKEVVQWLIDNPDRCSSVIGNHEQMLLNAYHKPNMSNTSMWTWNGGAETLDSYFSESKRAPALEETDEDIEKYYNLKKARRGIQIPEEHLNFFRSLPQYIKKDDLFISHSSWNQQIPFENVLNLDDSKGYFQGLTWHRGSPGRLPDNFFHVFGHTPTPVPIVTDYYANIDTGAVFVRSESHGKLTALHYPTMEIHQQENIDFPEISELIVK